jgi:hypothetical protein
MSLQVQQRQHLRHARGLARPGRQDRRGEPRPLPGRVVHALVVDPRLPHRDRPGRGGHLPRLVVAVADHQPATLLVDLVAVGVDVGGDLGVQRRGEHLPGPFPGELVQQRPTHRHQGVSSGPGFIVDYREHGRTFPNQRANAGS